MNNLLWGVQFLLAGVFLCTAAGKIFNYQQLVRLMEGRSKGRPVMVSRWQAVAIGLAEAAGALGLLVPARANPSHLIVIGAAAWLGLIMTGASIYHVRRGDSATPPVVLILLALFVIVGRWPR